LSEEDFDRDSPEARVVSAPPAPGIVIPPLGVGEVVDRGFSLARQNFRYLVGIAAWAYVISSLIATIFGLFPLEEEATTPEEFAFAGLYFLLETAVSLAPYLVGQIVLVLACARIIDPIPVDSRPDVGDAYRQAARLEPAAFRLGLLALMATIPLLMFFPLGIYVFVRTINSLNAVVLEGLGAVAAVRRSWALTKQLWWHTTSVTLLSLVAIGILQATLYFAVDWLIGGGLEALGFDPSLRIVLTGMYGLLQGLVLDPFVAAVSVVLYYELRARAEGHDLERRIAGLEPAH
jgi:hypothetical protein